MVSVTAITPQHIRGRTEIQHWLAWLFCSVSKKWMFSPGIWYAHNLWVWLQIISLTIGMVRFEPETNFLAMQIPCKILFPCGRGKSTESWSHLGDFYDFPGLILFPLALLNTFSSRLLSSLGWMMLFWDIRHSHSAVLPLCSTLLGVQGSITMTINR